MALVKAIVTFEIIYNTELAEPEHVITQHLKSLGETLDANGELSGYNNMEVTAFGTFVTTELLAV